MLEKCCFDLRFCILEGECLQPQWSFLFSFFMSEHQFCGGKLTKSQGTIKTPNWPEKNYPPGISCSWLITVEPEMVREKKQKP